MSTPRSYPGKLRTPKLTDRIIVDTWRGKTRVRAWPKKRGPTQNPAVKAAQENFAQAIDFAKRTDGLLHSLAWDAAKGQGIYPRDVNVRQILTGIFDIYDANGVQIKNARPGVEAIMFQGFILQLAAAQAVTAGGIQRPIWPLPVRDTAMFWNPGNPTVITIPDGVTIMNFFGGFARTTNSGGSGVLYIQNYTAGQTFARQQDTHNSRSLTAATGPVAVTPGDEWSMGYFMSDGGTFEPVQTFFRGEIMEAA